MPKILVADDSITVRKVAERLLTEAGMEVALAASGEEAMAYLSTEHPDFIISDVIMPDKTGYDVCRFVRSHEPLASTPVLLISGIVNDEVNRQAESCRANGVLKKPFQGTSLQERVREILAKQANSNMEPEPSPVADVPAPAPEANVDLVPGPGSDVGSAPKAYRITEEQLRSFREASGRIKELEALLEDERARSTRLSEELQSGRTSGRVAELEAALAESHRQLEELTTRADKVEALERRNQELERTVADLRAVPTSMHESALSSAPHATVADLQVLLTEQQQRLTELANEIIKHGEAGDKVKALEASLADERARAADLTKRCGEMEQALGEARSRVEELTGVLTKIGRLVGTSDTDPTSY